MMDPRQRPHDSPSHMMKQQKRGPWSQQEDAYLLQLLAVSPSHNWVNIAQRIGTRSAKQCRERYHQNLKPTLNHDTITEEEGRLIERMVNQFGKKWADIARRLNGRSDNQVKNWWNGSMNRRKRAEAKKRHDQARAHAPGAYHQNYQQSHSLASGHYRAPQSLSNQYPPSLPHYPQGQYTLPQIAPHGSIESSHTRHMSNNTLPPILPPPQLHSPVDDGDSRRLCERRNEMYKLPSIIARPASPAPVYSATTPVYHSSSYSQDLNPPSLRDTPSTASPCLSPQSPLYRGHTPAFINDDRSGYPADRKDDYYHLLKPVCVNNVDEPRLLPPLNTLTDGPRWFESTSHRHAVDQSAKRRMSLTALIN